MGLALTWYRTTGSLFNPISRIQKVTFSFRAHEQKIGSIRDIVLTLEQDRKPCVFLERKSWESIGCRIKRPSIQGQLLPIFSILWFSVSDFSILILCLFTYKMGMSSAYSTSLSAIVGGPKKMAIHSCLKSHLGVFIWKVLFGMRNVLWAKGPWLSRLITCHQRQEESMFVAFVFLVYK